MRILSAAAAVVLVSGALVGQSQAASTAPARVESTETLAVRDVNFRDAEQVRVFHKRLQQSALFVCGASLEVSMRQRAENRACADKAVQDAVAKLDRPLLTAIYQRAGAPMVARGY